MSAAGTTNEAFKDSSVMVCIRVRPFNEREKSMGSTNVVTVVGPQTVHMEDDASTRQEDARDFGFDQVFPIEAGQEEVYLRSAENVVRAAVATPTCRLVCTHALCARPSGLMLPCAASPALQVDKVIDGFNACVFAYGQTGALRSMRAGRGAACGQAAPAAVQPAAAPHATRCLIAYVLLLLEFARAGSGKTYTMMGPAGAAPSSSGEGIIPRMCRDILARLQAITDSKKAIGTVEAT